MNQIIFSTPIFGFPPSGGPELRITNSIKALTRIAKVSVQVRQELSPEEKQRIETELIGLGCSSVEFSWITQHSEHESRTWLRLFWRVVHKILMTRIRQELKQIVELYSKDENQVVWFGYGNISFSIIRRFRRYFPNAKIICDTDSVWSRFILREFRFARRLTRKIRILAIGAWKQFEERRLIRLATTVTAVSEVDATYYRSMTKDGGKVEVFSNVIDLSDYDTDKFRPVALPEKTVCLVGSFGHPSSPMDVGAEWLINSVWPTVLSQVPEAHLILVGKNSDKNWCDHEELNVLVTGMVPSTAPYLSNCRAVLVPLFFESGTRFKILEAGAFSRPVISTTLGAEGLPAKPGIDLIIADSSLEFAEAIVRILRGETVPDLGKNLNSLVKESFGLKKATEEAEFILSNLNGTKEP